MKETFKLKLEVELLIDGKRPPDEILRGRLLEALDDEMPRLILDDDELDCIVFVDSYCYEIEDDVRESR